MTTSERLTQLRNRATLHEMAISRGDRSYLVCYGAKQGRDAMFRYVTQPGRAGRIVALTGAESITFAKRVSDGATMGDWTIRFTGRTERQAIAEGELPGLPA